MHGKNRIGFSLSNQGATGLSSFNPATAEIRSDQFTGATQEETESAMQKAESAFDTYRNTTPDQRAQFLEAIADEILNLGDELVQTAMQESALPEGRIVGERGRTMGQLKLFASLLREGSWVEATIDTAQPNREPLPKPDIRKMLRPLGPVVVFTASNFPLAFSTAGGDTASALAAGCPVVVKAHNSHLHTNELVSDAISRAAEKTGMPDGVYSSLAADGFGLGTTLVKHPKTKAVAFTGSLGGGMALYKMAIERDEPIPVFAEMGSINPVIFLPKKLNAEKEALAKTYAGSITLGVGQFCTNPGLLIGLEGSDLDQFSTTLASEISGIQPSAMLNEGIAKNFNKNKESSLTQNGVKLISSNSVETPRNGASPAVARVSAKDFLANPNLQEEVFGPYSIVVSCKDQAELDQVIAQLHGQLTITFMGSDDDFKSFETQIHSAEKKTGRLIYNGVPTGVEVCGSMQHGGPFPAATDSRFTSVGSDAIKRFARPVAYQSAPQTMLPDELKDNNPNNVWREVDGQRTNQGL
ncbi:MAG: aldehyde dehydrogenase (NADP(+)) [Reichenbachiella sp.]|uniref:aldehyde dehydrogenase (NADP(+)) n=2 Tax=Reichenbachiella sp. TaxID=2184521 RepID=UPI0032645048